MPQPNGDVVAESYVLSRQIEANQYFSSMHIDYTGHAIVYMASLPLSINNLSHVGLPITRTN